MIIKYFVYQHVRKDTGQVFYIGVSKYYFVKQKNKVRKYDRAFSFAKTGRNKYWNEIFEDCGKKCIVEILSEFEDIKLAYKMEVELIKKYGKIHNKTGVLANMQDGGFVSEWGLPVISYDYEGNFIKKHDSVKDAAKYFKIKSVDNIYSSINYGVNTHKIYFHYFKEGFNHKINVTDKDIYVHKVVHPCFQYSTDGKLIKKWRCVEDAAKELKIDRGFIRKNIYGKFKTAKNFIFSYTELKF